MPNTGGPTAKKRKLLMSVAASRLLYAAPIWAGGSSMTSRNRQTMERVNRLAALRVIRAYKTVSGEAAAFLAGSPPLDLVAQERAKLWETRKEDLTADEKDERTREIRAGTIAAWPERWSLPSGKAEWTKQLLPNINRWLESGESGRLTFHLTQALTGHGCFGSYLCKIRRVATPHCRWCPSAVDDPRHTIFQCKKYEEERENINRMLGKTIGPEDVESILCGEGDLRWIDNQTLRSNVTREAESKRNEFVRMTTDILKAKEAEERARQAEDGTGRNPRRRPR